MPSVSFAVAIILALVVIALLVILIRRRPAAAGDSAVSNLLAARLAEVERSLDERSRLADAVSEAKNAAERGLAAASEALSHTVSSREELRLRLADEAEAHQRTVAARDTARQEAGDLRSRLAVLEETLEQERKQSAGNIALLSEAKERMTQEFKILASEVMQSHGETFSKQNREQIDIVLAPLREKLGEFQQGLQSAHTESVKERGILADQIRQLSEHSATMTLETSNLTRALKGEAQTQGAWGEMILESILERSALREGEEYVIQQSHTTEDGNRVRPDVVVNLPDGQKIVVDSKLSLVAFNDYVNAETEVERAAQLKRHVASLRSHIRTLSGKEYHSVVGSQLDYVVMFIPIEGALAVALREYPGLTAEAVAANVAIATPTTLMIALRTVANVWQVERRNRNADLIAQRAGKIYDKLVGFMDEMADLGIRLKQAQSSYDDAMTKLTSGKGNLTTQVAQLKELGAKTGKSLPAHLLDDIDEDVNALLDYSGPTLVKAAGG